MNAIVCLSLTLWIYVFLFFCMIMFIFTSKWTEMCQLMNFQKWQMFLQHCMLKVLNIVLTETIIDLHITNTLQIWQNQPIKKFLTWDSHIPMCNISNYPVITVWKLTTCTNKSTVYNTIMLSFWKHPLKNLLYIFACYIMKGLVLLITPRLYLTTYKKSDYTILYNFNNNKNFRRARTIFSRFYINGQKAHFIYMHLLTMTGYWYTLFSIYSNTLTNTEVFYPVKETTPPPVQAIPSPKKDVPVLTQIPFPVQHSSQVILLPVKISS